MLAGGQVLLEPGQRQHLVAVGEAAPVVHGLDQGAGQQARPLRALVPGPGCHSSE